MGHNKIDHHTFCAIMDASSGTLDRHMARILIAEDQADLREMLSFTLRLDGHQVVTAADGEEALNQALATSPDLIVLDIKMPGLSGFQVCEQLKRDVKFGETPIIIISALNTDEQIEAGYQAGASEFIPKPFSPQLLSERVKNLLEVH
jgi:DNA-binding response OmpR family regulator